MCLYVSMCLSPNCVLTFGSRFLKYTGFFAILVLFSIIATQWSSSSVFNFDVEFSFIF